MNDAAHPNLIVEREGHLITIRVDREDALGALSTEMLLALAALLRDIADDASARVVIVTGTGKGFIAGADIGEYSKADSDTFVRYQQLSRDVFTKLAAMPQPVIAAMNGYALGGGFELALCCDFRMAASTAKLGLPEVRLGLIPGGSGTQRLARIVGASSALELISTARLLTAKEAWERGILIRPPLRPEDLLTEALVLGHAIADGPAHAVRSAKRVINAGLDLALADGWTLEQEALSELFETAEAQEGIAAFLAKRSPRFS